jgi:exo-1,4-beta-D-glucosaminidase
LKNLFISTLFVCFFFVKKGFVVWMMNNARPQHYWHMFEYSGFLGGSFFGVKKANENFHAMMNPVDFTVSVYTSLFSPVNVTVSAVLYDKQGSALWQTSKVVSLSSNGVEVALFQIPTKSVLPEQLRFVELSVSGSRNVYWIPPNSQIDVIDWDNSTWYNSPCKAFANFTELNEIAEPDLAVSLNTSCTENNLCTASIVLVNKGTTVAFFVRLRLMDVSVPSPVDVLPASWSDNFVTLFPNQSEQTFVDYQSTSRQFDVIVEPYAKYANKS